MRVAGVDVGMRRIGLAVSDASATLARPWKTIAAAQTPAASARLIARALDGFGIESGELGLGDRAGEIFQAVVVGLPSRLGGGDTHLTEAVRVLAASLGGETGLPVHLQDERLSSHEAEARLGVRERDWRKRKAKLDAAAAAVILQDFLDGRADRAQRPES